ncbi:hypothetical protein GALMADRAFT_208255 [Galerina marginata CBS 339.88]|uniref:NTF2 domain-containing protein n=1 Tax=Galerina marginata (strain CBS 339.88) TaxID=685588 RepID=A0A067TA85_GALM3|nr:hypothetical protein GALMADRAFT_208255 [Galerina marginata CBS 339.88]
MTTSIPSTHHSNVVPSEVGWQFVPQYYTFVNKEPHRLHCFYNKNSTFIHGTEGEDVKPCYGQQEIHNKITSIGFEDCKVFIHSVDAQSSANGGIIIQVIGEMSNHGETWRKFVQTFFLAEQPNGYFVLNDIFRFLKEEAVESDDVSETDVASEAATPATLVEPVMSSQPIIVPEPAYEPPREPTPPPAPAVVEPTPPAPPVPVDEAPTTDVAEPVITQTPTPAPEEQQSPAAAPAQPNGVHTPEPEKAAPAATPASVTAEPSPTPSPAPPTPAPAPPAPATAPAPPSAPTTATAPAQPAPVAAPTPTPAPPPAAPAAPRSWASLAASNPKKWGAAVAQESRGTTETLSPSPAPTGSASQTPVPTPAPAVQRPQGQQQQHQQQHGHGQQHGPQQGGGGNQPQGGRGHESPAYLAAQGITHAQCFVKGVVEPISQTLLQTTLTQRFGPIKELEIVRAKACAFLEFASVDSARRAITASLGHGQGGEGGVWVDVGGEVGQLRLSVETKKERGERPPSRPRGGAPPVAGNGHGDGRGAPGGGFRGRGGRGGRGAAAGK